MSVSIFEIIGPVMIGPSSSHTAGAVRIGSLARRILGQTPEWANITLYGSFKATYRGHGTDKALTAGLLGMRPDDERIRGALALAEREGLKLNWILSDTEVEHANTARIQLGAKDKTITVQGSSLGGGRVAITSIDDFPVYVTGQAHSLITCHDDRPGMVAKVAQILANNQLNVGALNLSRRSKGDLALMVVETDEAIPATVKEELLSVPLVHRLVSIPFEMDL